MRLLASYPFLNIYLHEGATAALEAQWLGFVSSAVLRQTILEALRLGEEHRITAWIADDRLLGPVRPVDLEWVAQEALPRMAALGLKRFARVEAEDPLNKMLIGQVQEAAEPQMPFALQLFNDVAAARKWALS